MKKIKTEPSAQDWPIEHQRTVEQAKNEQSNELKNELKMVRQISSALGSPGVIHGG